MKVLFAVSNDNITTSVVSKYQQTYKEIITSKNVYYFNAIIKELQNNKTYDAIVIGEDLEPISNNNYEAIDKFLFEKLDRISDEASKPTGEDIPIIFICTERRSKSSQLLRKLFSMSIYNALIGNDRSVNMVCSLINKPRNKKEAKRYYQIETDQAEYEKESEELVSEEQIQNILNYYKKIGSNETKCVEAFDSIAKQYDNTQLRIIVKFLPMSVKAILETNSPTYQQLMTGGTVLSNGKYNKYKPEPAKNANSLDFLEKDLEKTKLADPVVIPSTMNLSNIQVTNSPNNYNSQANTMGQSNTNTMWQSNTNNMGQQNNNTMGQPKATSQMNNTNPYSNMGQNYNYMNNNNNLYNNNYNLYNQQNRMNTNNMQSSIMPNNNTQNNNIPSNSSQNNNMLNNSTSNNNTQYETEATSTTPEVDLDSLAKTPETNSAVDNQLQAIVENSLMAVDPVSVEPAPVESTTLESVSVQPMPVEPVKRGRGRPRKNPIETDLVPKVKRGRGRPRKQPIEELSPLPEVDTISSSLPEIDSSDALSSLPGIDSNNTLNPITTTESANDTLNRLLGTDSTSDVESDFDTTSTNNDTLNTLPGIDVMSEIDNTSTQDVLPGLESIETSNTLLENDNQNTESDNTNSENVLPGLESVNENTKTGENFIGENGEEDMNNFNQSPYGNNTQRTNQNGPYGMNSFNQNPYGNDMNSQNSYGMNTNNQNIYGRNTNNQNIYGMNNNNQNPYGNGMNNYNQNPYVNDMNNNQTPYGNDMNNNQNPYGNGMNNYNPNPYGGGMNNYNPNPYGGGMNNYNPNPYGAGMNNNNQNLYGNGIDNNQNQYAGGLNNPYGNDASNIYKETPINNNLIDSNEKANNEPNGLVAKNGKIALFIGTTKNGTSFIVNNLATVLSNSGIKTAIIDLTKNRNAYYMFTDNKADLMKIASNSLRNLQNGVLEGVKVNNNLVVYTGLPDDDIETLDPKAIISNATSNYEVVLLDCDFKTDTAYYTLANEIYLVQSMDAFTIQPLTKLLSELKTNNLLDESKLRVIVNKHVKTSKLDTKMIIGGMSKYNEPSMTLQRDIFNPDNVQSIVVPFEEQNYTKYIEDIAMCHLSLNGYSKALVQSLEQLKNMVYPLIAGNSNDNNNNFSNNQPKKWKGLFGNKKEEDTTFSNDMNSTLDKMRTNY